MTKTDLNWDEWVNCNVDILILFQWILNLSTGPLIFLNLLVYSVNRLGQPVILLIYHWHGFPLQRTHLPTLQGYDNWTPPQTDLSAKTMSCDITMITQVTTALELKSLCGMCLCIKLIVILFILWCSYVNYDYNEISETDHAEIMLMTMLPIWLFLI